MQTVVIAAAKGGTGKSSLTAALATAAAMDMPDRLIGVVDLDPQGSLTKWWNDREADRPHLCNLNGATLAAAIPGLRAAGFDLIFVDSSPGFYAMQRETIAAADLVLVPAKAGSLDLSAIASTVEMAEQARVPYRTLLNAALFRSRMAGRAVEILRARGGMLWPPVHHRVAIAEAMETGRTALETERRGAAARELRALWCAVRAILDAMPDRRVHPRPRMPLLSIARRTGA